MRMEPNLVAFRINSDVREIRAVRLHVLVKPLCRYFLLLPQREHPFDHRPKDSS
jgi:hypothetical protein